MSPDRADCLASVSISEMTTAGRSLSPSPINPRKWPKASHLSRLGVPIAGSDPADSRSDIGDVSSMARLVLSDTGPLIGWHVSKDSWLQELIGIVTVTSELDDCLARREAKHAGLQVVGVAAIVGMAELQGLTPSARAVFEKYWSSIRAPRPEKWKAGVHFSSTSNAYLGPNRSPTKISPRRSTTIGAVNEGGDRHQRAGVRRDSRPAARAGAVVVYRSTRSRLARHRGDPG